MLLVRPIFAETGVGNGSMPSAAPEELAAAIADAVEAGARVINLSVSLVRSSPVGDQALTAALDYAARRGAITVAAAETTKRWAAPRSRATVGHSWVACDLGGRPLGLSTLGGSIGGRGLSAPGRRSVASAREAHRSRSEGRAPRRPSSRARSHCSGRCFRPRRCPSCDSRHPGSGSATSGRSAALDARTAHRNLATTHRGWIALQPSAGRKSGVRTARVALARFHQRRGHRVRRRRQAGDGRLRDQALRRLRAARRGAQPLARLPGP